MKTVILRVQLCLVASVWSGILGGCQSTVRLPVAPAATQELKRAATTTDALRDTNIVFGTPKTAEPVQILVNEGYTVGYSSRTRTPLWVSYRLFAVGNKAAPPRVDNFRPDPRVPNPVKSSDYVHTGYDQGHMAPNAPIGKRYGPEAQDKTFLMTNMVPQVPGLNQRGWAALEAIISDDWAERFKELWVIAGPIFQGPCKELMSGVKVPNLCYMVIVYRTPQNEVHALGVIMPQRRINLEPLSIFVVPIDEIERLTGIDFLSELPDDVENEIEARGNQNPNPEWHIEQMLKPSFPAPDRPIVVRDRN